MKSPERISLNEFRSQLEGFIHDECAADPERHTLVCAACMNDIRVVLCYVSLHVAEMNSCAGPGTVHHMLIPFCSTCEPAPEMSGCVHMSYALVRNFTG